jgi:hypothetical protein
MTDAPKKRPWLQFHLSTAVVLTFVAAGLLWANVTPCEASDFNPFPRSSHLIGETWQDTLRRGWPTWYRQEWASGLVEWRWSILALDTLAASAILLATAALLEWLIRRRERRP